MDMGGEAAQRRGMHGATRFATLCLALLAQAATAGPSPGHLLPTGDMVVPRSAHTATLLRDGRVLVAGGREERWPWRLAIASAELYDPRTGTFARTGDMIEGRAHHTATLLADGRVLLIGSGRGQGAELYDPATGTFRPTGSPRTRQQILSAARLANGKVLVSATDRAEIYDPATGTFEPAAPYPRRIWNYEEYYYPTATTLADGRVLLVGGLPTMLYDPSRDRFDFLRLPDFGEPGSYMLWAHSATLLADGKVLVAGGLAEDSFTTDAAALFEPAADRFVPAGRMPGPRQGHAAVRLHDGRVLFVGGTTKCGPPHYDCALPYTVLYEFNTATFAAGPALLWQRSSPSATLLANGDVLLAGGRDGSAELYRAGVPAAAALLVTEYADARLDRYVMTPWAQERVSIESGSEGPGWARTDTAFWVAHEAHPGWDPVCRFRGVWHPDASSRFYTIDPSECEQVKRDPGWAYEGIAFFAVRPAGDACPGKMRVLWRAYNGGFAGYPNHRYATDRSLLEAMAGRGWIVEGAAMCVEWTVSRAAGSVAARAPLRWR